MSEKKCKYCAMMIPKDAKICPHCRKTLGWTLPAKIFAGFFLLIVINAAMNSGNNSSTSTTLSPSLSPKEEALSAVKLKYEWGKAGFDNVMEANFTIENQSKYDVKDIEIKCTHFAKSGTVIDSNTRTIYDIVKAKSKKRFDKFSMGFIHSQANSSACEITDLKTN
jgi:hypothetical protein